MGTIEYAIEAHHLKKQFTVSESGKGLWGSVKALFSAKTRIVDAVNGVSFAIRPGEFVGYVGENGAGKSTTIKMLTGILVPSSGTARVNGVVPYEDRKKNGMNIGVVFGQRTQLWWDLPVRETYEMLRVIYRVPKNGFDETMKKLSAALDLGPLMEMPVRKLSLGQRMRCDIAASLVHRPGVLFLDEPTIGLDVLAKENIRTFLKDLNKTDGTTIILTTHDMNDIEQLCRRLIILDKGIVIYDGATEDLKQRFVHDKLIEVEFHEPPDGLALVPELLVVRESGTKKWLKFQNGNSGIAAAIGKLASMYPVKDLSVREPSVESIIRAIYEKTVLLPEHKDAP
ncbi:MAG: ATP-binding cassette domain-containing protein [Nitrospinae bacterium]|nr:ATP-binding cassette domain-containing protein [Nitrospinota bacterium]